MNERHDELSGLARVLDRPAAPRAEFADALLKRLLAELEPATIAPSPSRPRRLGFRSLGFALAFAVALLCVAVTTVVLNRPQRASALDVIRQARSAFAHMPPFQATYKLALNPDGRNPNGPRYAKKGATATVALSYGGPHRLRTQILAEHGFTAELSPGSYQIYNGHSIEIYDAMRKRFFSLTSYGFQPLEFLSWHGAYPDWERVCRGPNSRVLSDARIAGRDARHIRCGNFNGNVWELWIDRQTGLLLKVVGQVGGDDIFLVGGISTSANGGFEIQRLRYNPQFAQRTFSTPSGAFDAAAALHATLAKLPPFRAVYTLYGPAGREYHLDEVWWLNEQTWRDQTLIDDQHGQRFSGAGSFSLSAHGMTYTYTAHDKTYYPTPAPGATIPPPQLLDYLQNSLYSPARCPIVGHEWIDGRETDHRRCARYAATRTAHTMTWATLEFWIDAATGLALRSRNNGHDFMRVNSIQYHPRLPAPLFKFVPPAGSHNLDKLEENPYDQTKLSPGWPAPNWQATTLAGGRFQLTDLRGKPVLLLLLGDWCGDDPACNDLAPLEQAYKKSNHKTKVIWIDLYGNPRQARKLARLNHLTFPVVVDAGRAMTKAWAIQAAPEWVLLDSRGRVIEARLKPQTVAQLTSMLADGRASR